MKPDHDPKHLNLPAFAKAAGRLSGSERLAHFERLLEDARDPDPATRVQFAAQAEIRQDSAGHDQVWLHLEGQVELSLTCQRCLEHMVEPVSFVRDFRFVATEAQAALEDEISEEDVLVLSRSFDLLELVEDELLMAMPIAPMHVTCPQPVRLHTQDADFEEPPEDKKPNPFAVLEQLRARRP